MGKVLLYQNAQRKLFDDAKDEKDATKKVEDYYSSNNSSLEDASKIYSVRIYFVDVSKKGNKLEATIYSVSNSGKMINPEKSTSWTFKGRYEDKEILIKTFDKKDITYHLWEILEYLLEKENKNIIEDLDFTLEVKTKDNSKEYNQKQKLILFFSKKGNWGRLWKYEEVREAMKKEGLDMIGRGIEGERPREFRYDLGYPFITSEQDKDVPDGFFRMDFPFPNQPRNERRMATTQLEKEDWTELLEILKKAPKKLRCYECGLFEDETNKIGQKTKFEKGHLQTHSSGGDVSEENIVAICKYCNSEQKNVYSYDSGTGKKNYHVVPFLKNRNYAEKIEALNYLVKHMKSEDVLNLVKTISK